MYIYRGQIYSCTAESHQHRTLDLMDRKGLPIFNMGGRRETPTLLWTWGKIWTQQISNMVFWWFIYCGFLFRSRNLFCYGFTIDVFSGFFILSFVFASVPRCVDRFANWRHQPVCRPAWRSFFGICTRIWCVRVCVWECVCVSTYLRDIRGVSHNPRTL